jgi:siroheme synthase
MQKKGAMELSIGTIVIIVLAMSMLILGLVLVRTIFTGAKYNVDTMSKKVEGEINKLFVEDKRAVLYLPNRIAEIKQGDPYGVAFGIQNVLATQTFKWKVEVDDSNIKKKCGSAVSETKAEEWVTTGREGSVAIATGQKYSDIMRFNIPEGIISDISTCIVRYQLIIEQDDKTPYQTESFDVDVR